MNNINMAIIFADYKKSMNDRVCDSCAFNNMSACSLFDFNFDDGFVCTRYRDELPPQLETDNELEKWLG